MVAGERRWRAHKLLELETIWAIKTEGNPDEIAMIENLQRENLDPMEEAEGLARLVERHNWTHDELGKAVGKDRTTVTATLKLNELPEQIKNEYRDTGVSKSVLIEISRVKDSKDQARFWNQIKNGKFSVKKARDQKIKVTGKNHDSQGSQAVKAGKILIKKLLEVNQFEKVDYDELLKIQKEFAEIINNWPFGEE